MFAAVVLAIQLICVIFIGGFMRTTTALTKYDYFTKNCLFMLCLVLICAPYKKLTIHAFMVMLIVITIAFEMQLLIGQFWYQVFKTNFQTTSYEFSERLLIECSHAMLMALIVSLDFIGIFQYWQIYLIITPILTFGFSLNFSINVFGLGAFDGGGGFTIFLYSGAASLVIWFLVVRGKYPPELHEKDEHYSGGTLALIGVVGATVFWPLFNASGGLITKQNTILTSSQTLEISGYMNTLFSLSVGITLAFLLAQRDGSIELKQRLRSFLDCFLNAGIVTASFVDVCINPAAPMTAALISTVITLLVYRYFRSIAIYKNKKENLTSAFTIIAHYSRILFRIILPLVGLLFSTVVVRTRNDIDPLLLENVWENYAKKSALQIAVFFISIAFGVIFGLLASLATNFFLSKKQKDSETAKRILNRKTVSDLEFFQDLQNQEIYPLYLQKQDYFVDEDVTARKILKQSILSHIKQEIPTKRGVIKSNLSQNQTSIIVNHYAKQNSPIRKQNEEIQRTRSQTNFVENTRKQQMPQFYKEHQESSGIKKSRTESRLHGLSLISSLVGVNQKNDESKIKEQRKETIIQASNEEEMYSSNKNKFKQAKPLLQSEEKPKLKVIRQTQKHSNSQIPITRKLEFSSQGSQIQDQNQHDEEKSNRNQDFS